MAQQNSGSPSRAFFLELVLVLVIFTFCAAVCLQVFAAAKTASETSRALSVLTVEAQSMAEAFKASDGDLKVIAKATAATVDPANANQVVAYYDANFRQTDPADTPYQVICVVLPPAADSNIAQAKVTVIEHGKSVATIDASQYIPNTKGGVNK
jgi:type II secretory pathway pseudopilin PulG